MTISPVPVRLWGSAAVRDPTAEKENVCEVEESAAREMKDDKSVLLWS